jgi:hypothetical protein
VGSALWAGGVSLMCGLARCSEWDGGSNGVFAGSRVSETEGGMEGVTEDDGVVMPASGVVAKQGRGHGLTGARQVGDAVLPC